MLANVASSYFISNALFADVNLHTLWTGNVDSPASSHHYLEHFEHLCTQGIFVPGPRTGRAVPSHCSLSHCDTNRPTWRIVVLFLLPSDCTPHQSLPFA